MDVSALPALVEEQNEDLFELDPEEEPEAKAEEKKKEVRPTLLRPLMYSQNWPGGHSVLQE